MADPPLHRCMDCFDELGPTSRRFLVCDLVPFDEELSKEPDEFFRREERIVCGDCVGWYREADGKIEVTENGAEV